MLSRYETTRTLLLCLGIASLLLLPGAAWAAAPTAPTAEEMWALIQSQQAEIAELRARVERAEADSARAERSRAITEERLDATTTYVEEYVATAAPATASRTTIGSYGEMHYNNLHAEDSAYDNKEMDYHRFVLFLGHEFTDRFRFFSEVEIEHALVEDTDDGSGAGEVELEQAYVDYLIDDNYYARAGLFLLPVGILNETHEPTTFYGVERNDVENVIVPTTWWEGGVGAGGRYGNGVSWDAGMTSGLMMPTEGSNAFRVRSGRQKVSEAVANDLGFSARLRYTGIPGLEVGGTLYYQHDMSQEGGDGLGKGLLTSTHAILNRGPFSLRALWAQWHFHGDAVKAADADRQTGWYVEPSYRFRTDFGDLGLYSRYEDVRGARLQDRFDQWELGMNFWPIDNVVFKVDYRDRSFDEESEHGRDFTGVDLGVGYQF